MRILIRSQAKAKASTPKPPAEVTDERNALQRLEQACPSVAAAIRALLKAHATTRVGVPDSDGKLTTMGSASPGFAGRANDKERTTVATLDMLHDLVLETNLWNTNRKQDSEYRSSIVDKLGLWRGIEGAGSEQPAATASDGSSTAKATREELAASMYLRLVREAEGLKTPQLNALASLLGVSRLKSTGSRSNSTTGKYSVQGGWTLSTVMLNRKMQASVCALFLTLPTEIALYIDGAEANKSSSTKSETPFWCTSPSASTLRTANGVRLTVRNGAIVPLFVQSAPKPYPNVSPYTFASAPIRSQSMPPSAFHQHVAAAMPPPAAAAPPGSIAAPWATLPHRLTSQIAQLAPHLAGCGLTVAVHGLVNKPELNGAVAYLQSISEDGQRIHVLLQNGKVLGLKPGNLQKTTTPSPLPKCPGVGANVSTYG